jgi:hypothetical protein
LSFLFSWWLMRGGISAVAGNTDSFTKLIDEQKMATLTGIEPVPPP